MKCSMPVKFDSTLFIGIFNEYETLQFEEIKMYDIIYTWNLKKNTNECICKTDSQCRNIIITRRELEDERNKLGQLLTVSTNHHV